MSKPRVNIDSPDWKIIERTARQEIESLRDALETLSDARLIAANQGAIAAWRRVLSFGEPERQPERPATPGYNF